jgi:putative transposase
LSERKLSPDGTAPAFVSTGAGAPALAAVALRISQELQQLIARMAEENPTWGAPKIHAELQKLDFAITERSVARYLRRITRRGDPKRKWAAFLQNHREVIAAMDFFTVPTVTFQVLYCFFVIEHERRKILHCNVTPHPTAEWIVQQLREAFPQPCRYKYVILDRDRKFDAEVLAFLTTAGLGEIASSLFD